MTRLAVPRSYVVVAGVLTVAMIVQTLNRQWSNDWFLHAASLRELGAHPFSPHHPLLGTGDPDAELSPYLLALGLVVHVTHVSLVAALSIAGLVNLLAFLVVLPVFVRSFTSQRQASTWTLVFVLVLWGVDPWRWSGYLDLNSLGFGLAYPSMAAMVLALVTLTLLQRWCRRPSLGLAIGFAVAGAAMALVHPPTAVGAAVGAGAILISEVRGLTRRDAGQLLVAGAVSLLLVALWPLYPFFSLLSNSGVYDAENAGIYRSVLPRVVLLLLTAPALWIRWRRRPTDPLVLFVIGGGTMFVVGWFSGHAAFGRTLPLTALAAQIALADIVSERVAGGERRFGYVAGAIAGVGLVLSAPVLPRFVPRGVLPSSIASRSDLAATTRGWSFLDVVPRDDVVATQGRDGREVSPTFGGKTVASGYPVAFVPDLEQRQRDERTLFSTPDATERRRLIDRYGVRWLLMTTPFADDPSNRSLRTLGDVVHRDAHYTLLRLRPT